MGLSFEQGGHAVFERVVFVTAEARRFFDVGTVVGRDVEALFLKKGLELFEDSDGEFTLAC
jgi:hypothetical protein